MSSVECQVSFGCGPSLIRRGQCAKLRSNDENEPLRYTHNDIQIHFSNPSSDHSVVPKKAIWPISESGIGGSQHSQILAEETNVAT